MSEIEILQAALALPVNQRFAFVEEKCGINHALRDQILKKLQVLETDQSDSDLAESGEGFVSFWVDDARADPGGSNQNLESSPELLRRGQRIGPYTLIQSIGVGGMGAVWMAEQREPVKRRVALKVIKNWGNSNETLARFDAERQALAMMNHPNIARILDAGETPNGQPYFAMELVSGKPLTTYCDENRLGIDERLELFVDVCKGVQHAHQKGIIHRDLKPSNILVAITDGKAVVKVIDFGLAKALENAQRLTDQSLFTGIGQILGTLKYMSPEQASLDTLDIDTRTDIYALGVILYELLTGSTPLDDASVKGHAALKILEIIREKEPVKPSSRLGSSTDEQMSSITNQRRTDSVRLNRVLVGDLDWIVMKALEKDRTRRYETASGFAADIHRYLNSEPVVARPPSLNYRLRKFVRKNRLGVVTASLVMVALIAGVVGTSLAMVRAWDAEQLAEGRLDDAVEARQEEAKQRALADEQRKDADLAREIAENRRIESEKSLAYAKTGNEILGSVFADLNPDAEYYEISDLRNALGDNLQKAVDRLEGEAIGDPLVVAEMQTRLGVSLQGLGKNSQAFVPLERALKTRTEMLGLDHSDTLNSLNELAVCYTKLGELKKAIPLMEQVLEQRKSNMGPTHPSTLNTMGNLATLYWESGQPSKARPLMEQTLEQRKIKLGPDHADTLKSMDNLATLYSQNGQPNDALPLFEQVLAVRKSKFGSEHPETLTSMNNLGMYYRITKNLNKAVPLLEHVLKLRTETLGAKHSLTQISMNSLAICYKDLGQLEKALPLLERVFEIRKTTLGTDHPDTMNSMNNLAVCYAKTGGMAKALPLWEQTLELQKTKLDPDHPYTLRIMDNLAGGYLDIGKPEKALLLFEKAMELSKSTLEVDHPLSIRNMLGLATAYKITGQLEKALPLYKQTLEIQRAKFGADHQEVLTSEIRLLDVYATAGQSENFLELSSVVLTKWRTRLAANSEEIAKELAWLSDQMLQLQLAHDAEPLIRECLRIRQAIQPEIWSTFNTQSLLGRSLLAQAKVSVDKTEQARLLAEAESMLVAGYEGMKHREASIPSSVLTRLPEALDRLVELYTLLDRPSEVEAYRNLRATYPVAGAK